MSTFKCRKCGKCCNNLLQNDNYGFYLSNEEVKHFPPDNVYPLFRSSGKITAWQLVTKVCPNLIKSDDKVLCGIYKNRPLSCRSLPLTAEGEVNTTLCPFANANDRFEEEMKALNQQLKELTETPQAEEMYLYKQHRWIKC